MLLQREFDAEQLAQDVVNAWGTVNDGQRRGPSQLGSLQLDQVHQ